MARQTALWLRETGRLFLRYLAVGASFIPAGLIYAGFHLAGWISPISAGVSLGIGFGTAHYVWNLLESRELTAEIISEQQTVVAAASEAPVLPGRPQLAVLGAAYFCSVIALGIQRPANLIDPNGVNAKSASAINIALWVAN